MRILISILIFLVSLSGAFCRGEEGKDFAGRRFIFDRGDNFYSFDITRPALAKAPHWKPGEEYPPLSPRSAEESARVQVKLIFSKFELESIALEPINSSDWVYVIKYRDTSRPIFGLARPLEIPVYFDGSAVKPRITKRADWFLRK